jgi:hypothetical protein
MTTANWLWILHSVLLVIPVSPCWGWCCSRPVAPASSGTDRQLGGGPWLLTTLLPSYGPASRAVFALLVWIDLLGLGSQPEGGS